MGHAMNYSIAAAADRTTHLKIVVTALIGVIMTMGVAITLA